MGVKTYLKFIKIVAQSKETVSEPNNQNAAPSISSRPKESKEQYVH